MSLDNSISIANSSLANISHQMAVISHNVANANTPDYAVEIGTQTALVADGHGYGVHQGVVVREIDLQLQAEALRQNGVVAGLQARSSALGPIDAAQGTPGQGNDLASKLGALQNSFTTLQADPSNASSQSQVVRAAAALASQINTLSSSYDTARQGAQNNIQADIGTLNTTLATLSDLTDRIVISHNAGHSTADLENQRDVAMVTMSKLVGVTFVSQPNGSMLAATDGGLALSLTNPPPQFSMASSTATGQAYYPSGGIAPILLNGQDVTINLKGGDIGANLNLRDTTLPTYQAEMDEFANSLQSRFSAQGLFLFTTPTPAASAVTQSGYLGYASTIAVNPAVIGNPATVRDGTVAVTGSLTGASAFTPNPSTGPASFSTLIGRVLSYAFGSSVQAGVAQPPPALSGLGPDGSLSIPFSAPGDLASFATSVVTSQSGDVSTAQNQQATEEAVQTTLQAQVSSSSSVSTDKELSKMVVLQNAYGATARILAAAQSMWNQLLAAVPAA
jgi:flagellar hook-associated protein 1 FlgK